MPAVVLPLHPPTQDTALGDGGATVAWVRSWHDVPGVVWVRRRWANAGDQDVPQQLILEHPEDVADFVGRTHHWLTLRDRAAELIERWGPDIEPAVRRHATAIAEHEGPDHARLVAAVDWLVAHPASNVFLRQLPVAGIDTKWLGSRRALVTALVTSVTHARELGLRQPPGLVRIRFLDAALAPGGLRDLAAPVTEIDRLEIRPDRVLVVENLESLLALPTVPRTVAVHGSGYAVDRLASIGWLRCSPITYWGDVDTDGFAILDRLRAHFPSVESVLMDEETLLAHRDLWVEDPNRASRASLPRLPRLTPGESAALRRLHVLDGVRLEQERLAWPEVLRALELG